MLFWLAALALSVQSLAESGEIEEVIVIAHPLSKEGLTQAVDILEGDELARKLSTNIGATLQREAGIHSSSFGNAVGRPVIHGLGGPRVRIMEDGIDTLDVSVTSADHAVAIEPFIAERIEVLKGSSSLLYGSGAIGGVVDVHTGRIPHVVPYDGITGGVESRYHDNWDGMTSALKLNGGAGSFAWHLDASQKNGDNYKIPGFAQSSRFRGLNALEEEDHEEASGTLQGSAFDSDSAALGASFIGERGFIGFAVSQLDSFYGLPGGLGHGHEEHDAEGQPNLDMQQTRWDVEAALNSPLAGFDMLNIRLGVNDYEHVEIEPNGEIATLFTNEAYELRSELTFENDVWRGAMGLQYTHRSFSAVGEEAFVPPVDSRNSGVFIVAERSFDKFELETGLRFELVSHAPSVGPDREFNTYAGSLGVLVSVTDVWDMAVLLDISSRAPVNDELYSNGPHLVTNAFELGDENLSREGAISLSNSWRYENDGVEIKATFYYTEFSGFIYQRATAEQQDGLPVFQFDQEDTRFVGFDLSVVADVWQGENGVLEARAVFDIVSASLDVSSSDALPRIPPWKIAAGLTYQQDRFSGSLEVLYVADQDDSPGYQLPTDSYHDVNLQLNWRWPIGDTEFGVFVIADNLTNEEQRHHTSFIKDFAPAPGRNYQLGARLEF
jgi:iron complex outermembrane receptor protein